MGNPSSPGKTMNLYALIVTEKQTQDDAKFATKDLSRERKGIIIINIIISSFFIVSFSFVFTWLAFSPLLTRLY